MASQASTGPARPGTHRGAGGRLVREVLRREPRLLLDFAAATVGAASVAVAPILLVELLVGRVLPARTGHSLLVIGLALAALVIADVVFRAARAHIAARLSGVVTARLSTAAFDGVLRSTHTAAPGLRPDHGAALEAMDAALGEAWPRLALDMAVLVLALPLMAYIDPTLALVIAGAGLLAGSGLMLGLRRVTRADGVAEAAAAERDAILHDTLAGLRTVQTLAIGPDRLTRWGAAATRAGVARGGAMDSAAGLSAVATAAERVLVLGTLALGIALPAWHGVPVAVAPLMAATLLAQRLAAILPTLVAFGRIRATARRATTRLDADVSGDAPDSQKPALAAPLLGAIVVEDVSVTYPGRHTAALGGVSFTLAPGTTLGVTGSSGAGKSTLARLLGGTIRPDHGSVRIDDLDLRDVPDAAARAAVLVVPQRSAFLAGTVRDVIAAGRRAVDFNAVVAAARLAGADRFVERLPRGFDTILGDGATALSAGQRQHLALARALAIDPPVLVLDEALNALDADVAAQLCAGLRAARAGRTTVIVSHDPTILACTDRVLTLHGGQLHDDDDTTTDRVRHAAPDPLPAIA